MKKIQLISSNLLSVGYNNSLELLEIEFISGGIYQYFKVPENIYKGLLSAPSHGKFFSLNIRNKFKYKEII